ncbi:uncharacterized protein LOC114840354 isoform X2 [Esox lucius]|uniref:uncharacterized protein LOC114840354 isoform X2 n=1 Tax=Esox lucius TaxID=8010 RepID=UPI00147687EB|nr:uncharacterized protein LOC114840354 isoform X2 [Esox lucius]
MKRLKNVSMDFLLLVLRQKMTSSMSKKTTSWSSSGLYNAANYCMHGKMKAAATAADMEREGLPDSPALIIQGESMTPSKWMLSVEREVVLGPFSEAFVEGLAALFATYYNLNLAYQDDAACTLEFIQRGLVGINPETGSKVAAGKRDKKMHGMNPHVCTLLRKLMDFEWLVI